MTSWRVETEAFDLGQFRIEVATNAGPRITSFARPNGQDFFASLDNAGIHNTDTGFYRFIGGHRLWRSPEVPAVTYQPDDFDVHIVERGTGIDIAGRADADGMTKHLSIDQDREFTIVHHRLVNDGPTTVSTAPWAITQMSSGGTAILPLSDRAVDQDGLLPNKNLVLWPYTDLGAPEFAFEVDSISVESSKRRSKMKIGHANRRGWMAYVLNGQAFVKWSSVHDDNAVYTDLGASTQCYRDERFLELETLGPIAELAPGEAATLTEVWTIFDIEGSRVKDVLARLPRQPEGIEL
jgi:hypothetical protein